MELSQQRLKGRQQHQLSLPLPLVKELISTLLAYGREEDRGMAIALGQAVRLDVTTLAADVLSGTGLIPSPKQQQQQLQERSHNRYKGYCSPQAPNSVVGSFEPCRHRHQS
jgi:hypothetical protein